MVIAKIKCNWIKEWKAIYKQWDKCVYILHSIMCSGVMYEFSWVLCQLCCGCKQYNYADTAQTQKQTSVQAKLSMPKLQTIQNK